jgi:hypothetical protein
MQKKLKGFYLLLSSLFIAALHLPFVFAKSASSRIFPKTTIPAVETLSNDNVITTSFRRSVYDSLQLQLTGLSKEAYDYAKKGFEKLVAQGKVVNNSIISIVDFSQPSSKKRLWVIDLKNYKVLFNTWVAHGRNSGRDMATSFSNQESSYKSSPGFYVTRETYRGSHGYSLKLDGVEKGINDNAYNRAIVIHGAAYVNPALIASQGYIGRSLGCPAVPEKLATPIINTIKNGSCLFIYHPTTAYVNRSTLLAA